jgi:hypothetical protein
MMFGEAIIARSIDSTRIKDDYGNVWQYHSQSDRHSKVACWAILFDLLQTCSLLRAQIEANKVGFGINHEMRDYEQDRKKDLDLVLCKRGSDSAGSLTFVEYGTRCGVVLTPDERAILTALPGLKSAAVSNVFIALEAKACMTEHIKALPRLHDELASSYQTIHGDTGGAIAAGFIMINCADSFISPKRNRKRIKAGKAERTLHKQPLAADRTLDAMMKIRRRSTEQEKGFDALGVTMIRCANDGSPVEIDLVANEKLSGIVRYAPFIQRISHLYATKFAGI